MAELGITCPPTSTATGGGGGAAGVDVDKLSLIRTGGQLAADTVLDINDPGDGWFSSGGPVLISGSLEFVEQVQTFRNGVLQLPGENSSVDNDVYFVASSGNIAFESIIHSLDVIQIWKFTATASG